MNAHGVCVEVGGLVGWLSYYLELPENKIHLDHIGGNMMRHHVEGVATLLERLEEVVARAIHNNSPRVALATHKKLGKAGVPVKAASRYECSEPLVIG